MSKKDLIEIIFLMVIAFCIGALKAEIDFKENKINELENTVEQQIELIDALQQ